VLPTRYASADNRIESNCVRPLNVVGSLTAIFESKRIDQRSQRSRLLPSTGVIEEEAGEGRAPIFEDSDQRPACEVRRNVILLRERERTPSLAGADRHVHVVEDQRPVDADDELLRALVELPSVHALDPMQMLMQR
jgi:hypothetical protein